MSALTADQRRRQYLTAALREFVAKGYHGTSTRSICATAGTSPGLLFHYFASKEALYDELVSLGCRHLAFDLDEALADPLAFFHHSAESSLAMVRENPEAALMFTFMTSAQRSIGVTPGSAELLRSHNIAVLSVPVIEAGQASGAIRDGDPLALSIAFWGAIQGIAEDLGIRTDTACVPDPSWLLDILRSQDL